MDSTKDTTNGAILTESVDSKGAAAPGTVIKPAFGAKVKRHCARFWWLHLLIFAIIVLVILLPIIYVGVKHKAQSEMNKATVNVTYQGITDPTPESFHLTLNTSVLSHSSYHPDLKSFNASLFLEDTEPNIEPFGYITIPQVHVKSEFPVDVDQDVSIANMDQFIAYNKLVVNSEEFRLAVRGKTKVDLSGLPEYDVDYNKVVTMKGLNKLSGFAITSAQVKLTPEADGATMLGTISIPNPSVLSIQMGNVTMDLSVNGTYIGYTLIQDLTLNPGNNSFDMRSYVNTTLALGLATSDLLLPLDIIGNSSINDAGDHLEYFEAAIKENTLHYTLNITEAL